MDDPSPEHTEPTPVSTVDHPQQKPDPNAAAIAREAATPQPSEFGPHAPDSLAIDPKTRERGKAEFTTGDSLKDIIGKSFFVADDAEEKELIQIDPRVLQLHYSDGSIITVRLEARKGEWNAVDALPADDKVRENLNDKYRDAKKAREDQLENAAKAHQENDVPQQQNAPEQNAPQEYQQYQENAV
jgi:hypothetical protein